MNIKTILRHHWLPAILTIVIWFSIGWYIGFQAFLLVVILTLLEMTLSADNAVVNSRILVTMSPLWQKLFLTIGILIAVFIMRFIIPILIVAFTTDLDSLAALQLALNDPEEYGHKLHDAAPLIDSFGGMFLFMVALFFFLDKKHVNHWVQPIEKFLSRLDSVKFIKFFIAAALIAFVYFMVEAERQNTAVLAMIIAAGVYLLLHGITLAMEKYGNNSNVKHKTGWAAFAAFIYLEVLDASFSLDGVVGAFALTNNIIIIMAGLGIGAVWVRTMTIHLVESKTLVRYKYLESGAHWAILFLSLIMLGKLFHIELPEIIIGSVGLVCIALSIISSQRAMKAKS